MTTTTFHKTTSTPICDAFPGVALSTDIPSGVDVSFVRRMSRKAGTGYADYVFRIDGSDDAIIVRTGLNTRAVLERGYFAKSRSYAQACGRLSREFNIPFEVALVLGTDRAVYPRFTAEVASAVDALVAGEGSAPAAEDDLCCGINRRKAALEWCLEQEVSEALRIKRMGQKNSARLADYILRVLAEAREAQNKS